MNKGNHARALLAFLLVLAFHAVFTCCVGALLYLPFALLGDPPDSYAPAFILMALVSAATIVWMLVPACMRTAPPGPRLDPSRQRELFRHIGEIAHATGQALPAEVYLVGDVNAWVAQRGGFLGFRCRRVLALGLPLLQMVTVSELRAVLAHEFGHFDAGDTLLGPMVHRTHATICRAISGLGDALLTRPLQWYGALFLLVCSAVSRQQEFRADAVAARVAGSRALIEGLKKVRAAAAAYDTYWTQEVQPVLARGFLPPIAEGFRRFANHERVATAMADVVERGMREARADPFDTHPPLAERIAAIAAFPPGPELSADPLAISLLCDVHELERDWLASVADARQVGELQSLAWEAVVDEAYLPLWREAVARNADALEGATIGELADVVREACSPPSLACDAAPDVHSAFARFLVATAFLLALHRAGWNIEAPPGAPVTARHAGVEIAPFELINQLADGNLDAKLWREEAVRHGIESMHIACIGASKED